MKLNLGCGFKKKEDYINVDMNPHCQPEVVLDLATEVWPWKDGSVQEVTFDFSLEQMGETKRDLLHVLKELYRVCTNEAKILITAIYPRHDQFALNPLCVHPLSPQFLQTLSVVHNLQQIANGESDTSLGMILGVDFTLGEVRFLIAQNFQSALESGQITEEQIRHRMTFENNICQAMEIEMVAQKREPIA